MWSHLFSSNSLLATEISKSNKFIHMWGGGGQNKDSSKSEKEKKKRIKNWKRRRLSTEIEQEDDGKGMVWWISLFWGDKDFLSS